MTPERIVTLRSVQGIDRAEDARISDSGSWYATINLWSKSTSGLLAKRPGSSCIIDGRDVERLTDTGADTTVPWTNNNGVLIPGPTTFTDGRINIVSTNQLGPEVTGGGVIDTTTLVATVSNWATNLVGTRGMVPKVNV